MTVTFLVFVISVVMPFPTVLLFLRPASAFMGTRSLQAHGVGCLLLVHISSYRFPSSSPGASSRRLAEAPNRDISASSGYLPTTVSLGPYE